MPAESNSRQAILTATIAALADGGAGALRIDGVAAAAEVNKRMIYHYFGDRQGLLDATFRLLTDCLSRASAGDLLPYFVDAFGSVGAQVQQAAAEHPALNVDMASVIRILLAEYCRLPRTDSKDLLTRLSRPAGANTSDKPRYRVTGVSRPTSRVLDPP